MDSGPVGDGAPPPAGSTNVGWGVRHVFYVYLLSLLGALVAAIVMSAVGAVDLTENVAPADLIAFVAITSLAQFAAMVVGLVLLSRNRGSGSLRRDFGLQISVQDAGAVLWGALLQIGAIMILGLILFLLGFDDIAPQEIAEVADEAQDFWTQALFFVILVIAAPIMEETLFRGALLRALLVRTSVRTAVIVSGTVFGLVHLLDPAALPFVPALVGLGIYLGWQAQRTGSLSRPILTHMGFNLVSTLLLLFA